MRSSSLRRSRFVLLVLTAAAIGVAACSSSAAGGGGGDTAGSGPASAPNSGQRVRIAAYSVAKPAYDQLAAAFQQTPQGRGVSFSGSYDASGTIRDKVLDGLPADYVAFSLAPDLTKLVPDLVATGWDGGATHGIVSDSVVVLAVRKGNPKHITGWGDIVKPGIAVVSPDPRSSGGARWNALAAYAHGTLTGGTEQAGLDFVKQVYGNVVASPDSAAKATQTFLAGTGDVLIAYENDVIATRAKGKQLDYVLPDDTFLIENPAAVTITAPRAAKDFLAYATSPAAQPVWTSQGFRPVLAGTHPGTVPGAEDPANPFPQPRTLTTVASLGGWTAVNKKFFDKKDGLVVKLLNG